MTGATATSPLVDDACQTCAPSRRTVLKGAAAAGLAGLLTPTLTTRVAYAADPAYSGDVLVVLSLRGGFDGLSAIAPIGDPAYRTARPTLAVPAAVATRLDTTFGLHPALSPLMPLWRAGTFGAVHAVGQPDGSRSHFQATEELERAAPGSALRTGWLDRVLGMATSSRPLRAVSLGSGIAPPALAGPSPEVATRSLADFSLGNDDPIMQRRAAALRAMHASRPGAAATALTALDAVRAVEAANPAGTGYPSDGPGKELGTCLRDLARLIKGAPGLQVACVDYGDWDMHDGLGTVDGGRMVDRLGGLAAALAAFAADLGPTMSRVTVVTLSEFGRRVAQNDSAGTDHGFGNAVLLLGGGVVGGKVHGRWPGLSPDRLDDGDLAGTTDYRDVLGELLRVRCGLTSLGGVFPGLAHAPLGVARARS